MSNFSKLESFEVFLRNKILAISNAQIREVLIYSLADGGKRIRPALYEALCHDFHIIPKNEISLCIECFHCASLMHDDLPAIDNDDLRRGKASTHKKFGEALAVLVGDFLPVFGLEIVSANTTIPVGVMGELCRAYKELCIGQVLDVEQKSENVEIQKYKTGALFNVVFMSVLESLTYTENEKKNLRVKFKDASESFGVLFQLIDDFLDVFGTEESTGKEPGSSDVRKNKKTLFSHHKEFSLDLLTSLREGVIKCFSYIEVIERECNISCSEVKSFALKTFSRGGLFFTPTEVSFNV